MGEVKRGIVVKICEANTDRRAMHRRKGVKKGIYKKPVSPKVNEGGDSHNSSSGRMFGPIPKPNDRKRFSIDVDGA